MKDIDALNVTLVVCVRCTLAFCLKYEYFEIRRNLSVWARIRTGLGISTLVSRKACGAGPGPCLRLAISTRNKHFMKHFIDWPNND